MYTIVFIDEDSDIIYKQFSTLEEAEDFESHFEDEILDYDDPNYDDDSPYWTFGYEPKHLIIEGKVIKVRT